MNGRQFIRRARKWAKANGRIISVEKSRGKGGHQIVRFDNGRWTTVKTGEIGTGLLNAMFDQLGIPKEEF
jgi:mRNA interferase HicA